MKFADWITAEIQRMGLLKHFVAEKIGVDPGTLSLWINGHRRPKLKAHIRAVAAFFGVTEEFIRGMK